MVPFAEFDHNMVINWLKHYIEPDEVNIPRYEAIIIISRSISKFVAVYWQISRLMDLFLKVHHDPIFRGKDDNAGCGRLPMTGHSRSLMRATRTVVTPEIVEQNASARAPTFIGSAVTS